MYIKFTEKRMLKYWDFPELEELKRIKIESKMLVLCKLCGYKGRAIPEARSILYNCTCIDVHKDVLEAIFAPLGYSYEDTIKMLDPLYSVNKETGAIMTALASLVKLVNYRTHETLESLFHILKFCDKINKEQGERFKETLRYAFDSECTTNDIYI